MKSSLIFGVFLFSVSTLMFAQPTSPTQDISTVIHAFAKAGDQQDAEALEDLLDPNYRVVMNQLFGATTVLTLDREAYLTKIRNKEFGGDERKVQIETLSVQGKTATARVRLTGQQMALLSFFVLVQDASGQWKLVSDVPNVL
ncbi:MAG: nuclear transport factor 2 family protein [Bacteroidota bacterium]